MPLPCNPLPPTPHPRSFLLPPSLCLSHAALPDPRDVNTHTVESQLLEACLVQEALSEDLLSALINGFK